MNKLAKWAMAVESKAQGKSIMAEYKKQTWQSL